MENGDIKKEQKQHNSKATIADYQQRECPVLVCERDFLGEM